MTLCGEAFVKLEGAEILGLQRKVRRKIVGRQFKPNVTLLSTTRISVAIYFLHNFRSETREKSFESVSIGKQSHFDSHC